MPYIEIQERNFLKDCIIDENLLDFVKHCDDGTFNYIITLISLERMKREKSYKNISDVIKILGDVEHELRRRVLEQYEDTKIFENGDIKEIGKMLYKFKHGKDD